MSDFQWPWQYSFPPFFTLQVNLDTRQKQIDAWCSLILDYYKHHKLSILDVGESQTSVLFFNQKINRKLSADVIILILDELRKRGNVEWLDKGKKRCLVMWKTPEEWANIIYKWVSDNGMTNTVCTLYELISGDDTKNQEFHGLDNQMLLKSLGVLQHQRKAELISTDGSVVSGVKFF